MFLDYFRPRLYNPKTGERWIERRSPVDIVLGTALAIGAALIFVLVTLSIVAHARHREQTHRAQTRAVPAQLIPPRGSSPHLQPKSPAEHKADLFRGSQQALDRLGNLPAEPALQKGKTQ